MTPIVFNRSNRSDEALIAIYSALVFPRLIEEKMLVLLRQGKISKWFSGIGQEAVSVGIALAMDREEYLLPMHRNLGVFTQRGVDLTQLFEQFRGTAGGFTKGRDRSFHFGSQAHKLVGMISHLGAQMGVADGIALAHKLRNEVRATLVVTGDGGASEGDFHEAINLASVWKLPVIFLIENNGYGLSTPSAEQFNFESFRVKGPAYGIPAHSVDGNNILEVTDRLHAVAQTVRTSSQPAIFEVRTFRMRGHEEASGTKYVPHALMEYWQARDPVLNYERFLLHEQVLSSEQLEQIKAQHQRHIDAAIDAGFSAPPIKATSQEKLDVFAPFEQAVITPDSPRKSEKRFIDAISEALSQSLDKYPELILMGQDIAEYGGVFKVTEGFLQQYGKERIRNTPISESAVLGASLGLSIAGYKSVVEMQFADFVSCGFNQITNNLAKSHYRWGQQADVVVRLPTGGGLGAGPFHSQSNEAWFFHTPGLKILYPSNPHDAKGLLNAAIEDPNPVLFFEHKALYRSLSEETPDDYYTAPIGIAKRYGTGADLSIITYGMGVHWAQKTVQQMKVAASILDLRSLLPWDKAAVREVVAATNRVIVLHEATMTGGIGAEIAAWISEHCFESLDAPVIRVGSQDTPVPFAKNLEENFLPLSRLQDQIAQILRY